MYKRGHYFGGGGVSLAFKGARVTFPAPCTYIVPVLIRFHRKTKLVKQVISVGREINWIFNCCVEEETEKLHTHTQTLTLTHTCAVTQRDSGADVSGVSGEWRGESSCWEFPGV